MMRSIFDKIIWCVLLFLIFFSPLALASNRPTPLFLVETAVFIGVLAWFCRAFFLDRALSWCKSSINPFLIVFLILGIIQTLLPKGSSHFVSQTFYLKATVESIFKSLTYVLSFWLVLNFLKSQKQVSNLIRVIFILSFGVSLLGILESLSKAKKVMWFYQVIVDGAPYDSFFSTFVNSNHFAAFIGMLIFLILGRFLYLNARYGVSREKTHREERIFLLFVLVISNAALFMSLSRGCCVIFILVLFLFYRFILKEPRKTHSKILINLFIVSTCLMLLWIGLSSIISELSTLLHPREDVSLLGRLVLWRTCLETLFLKHSWLGSGLGTFQYVFPRVQPLSLYGFWRHAHNDWLELLLETGLMGCVIVFLILFSFFREVRKTRTNESDLYIKYNGSAAIAAVLFMCLVSLYDFPLRTTACAIYFAIVCALAVRLRMFHDEAEGIDRVGIIPLDHTLKRLAVMTVALVFFVSGFAGIARPYLALCEIRKGGKYSVPHLEKAIRWDPLDADYRFWLGLALGEEATYGRRQYNREEMKQAFDAIGKAIRLNPGAGKYDYGLAILSQRMGDREGVERYFQSTLLKEPSNPFFHLYYAIYNFNQAMVENVLYEKNITSLGFFKKGLAAYLNAKKILPSISLSEYSDYLANYDKLMVILHDKGVA